MKTVRKAVTVVLAAALAAACSQPGQPSNSEWWGNHFKGYGSVIKRDSTNLYRSIDRHFFNYDWDDPSFD